MEATLENPAGYGTQDFDFLDPVAAPIGGDVDAGGGTDESRDGTGGGSGGGGRGGGGGGGAGSGSGGASSEGGGGFGGGPGEGGGGMVLAGGPTGHVRPADVGSVRPPWFARFRIYHPAPRGSGGRQPVLDGTYPLVLFAHGMRTPGSGSDPPDPDHGLDHRRWGGVLSLMARTGIVVASVDMAGALGPGRIGQGIARLRTIERYLYDEWEHRRVMTITPGDWASGRGHLPMGLAGHSFGAGTCAHYANVRGSVGAIASVAADWSTVGDVRPREELVAAGIPTLFISGARDELPSGPDAEPYLMVDPPRHAALVQAAGHWDWFDDEGLQSPASGYEPCKAAYRIAAELLTVFFHRYLRSRRDVPPSLLTGGFRFPIGRPRWVHDAGDRPPLDLDGPCAVRVYWRVPGRAWPRLIRSAGHETLGPWDSEHAAPAEWP